MVKKVSAVRGMRDFLPAQKAKRERVLRIIREVYAAHGFDEIEAPMVEAYERLHAGLGGDNEKLSFSILKRGLAEQDIAAASCQPGELCDLGLRFDLTVPLARYYASNRAQLPSVFRAVHIGPVWRAERPQQGRYRQFVQADIDIIGESSELAELELITATSYALTRLGLEGCVIRINDRRILTALLEHCGFAAADFERILITVDKLDKIGVDGVVAELTGAASAGSAAIAVLQPFLERVQAAPAGAELTAEAITEIMPGGFKSPAFAHLVSLGAALKRLLPTGVRAVFDPTLVRGMGYYTGTIFEISHPASGSSVGGGGRYDGMIGRFLGQDVPAVGFSVGFERIIDLVQLSADDAALRVALIADKDCDRADLAALKLELLGTGRQVQLVWRQKNMKPLFEQLRLSGVTEVASVRSGFSSVCELDFRQI